MLGDSLGPRSGENQRRISLFVLALSRKDEDLVPELGGETVPALGKLIERRCDPIQKPLLFGREQDPAGSDDPEPTPLRDGSSSPFIEEEKTTGALPREQDGTCFTRAKGKTQRLQFLAASGESRLDPACLYGRAEYHRARPVLGDLELLKDLDRDQDLAIELA